MAFERIVNLIVEVKGLVDKVQAAIDQRPLLQTALNALKAKIEELEKAATEEPPPPAT